MRIGIGYDIHPLGPNRKFILGGVEIPHRLGLIGHSDADALLHAICDALLGAMGEGDLGQHYPSSDARYKDMASAKLLDDVSGKLHAKGYKLVNVDTVIIAQAPKLAPHLSAMEARIAEILKVAPVQVNVKVKSGEGVGAVGREEAIATHAVCLIERAKTS
ncbi:MAG: 2-C-methyl-D-erythritol 2,4-cyclodiphosphate synthase [Nitrospira sp.]|nr:MAG: 2-C-methyl-D-erythritol 2,4-cyclodiphosphate synthase [Nitrospira sp.]